MRQIQSKLDLVEQKEIQWAEIYQQPDQCESYVHPMQRSFILLYPVMTVYENGR